MEVLSNGFSPANRVRGFLQLMLPKFLACPGTSDYSPLLLGSVLKLGNLVHLQCQQARCLQHVCVSLPPDINSMVISLLEQVERGKCLPALGVSGTLREAMTVLRLERGTGYALQSVTCQ